MMGHKESSDMNLQRFREIVESYGAEAERWPADERADALAFLGENAGAAPLQLEARLADALLAIGPQPAAADDALVSRLMALGQLPQPHAAQSEIQAAAPKGSGDFSLNGFFGSLASGFAPLRGLLPQAGAVVIAGFLGVYLGLSGAAAYDQPIEIDAGAFIFDNPSLIADLEELG
jgi:hypothetical protein